MKTGNVFVAPSAADDKVLEGLDLDSELKWISSTFGEIEGDDFEGITYGNKHSLSFIKANTGAYVWHSKELDRGGTVAALRKNPAAVKELQATVAGTKGNAAAQRERWEVKDFRRDVWAEGSFVDGSEVTREFLSSRKLDWRQLPTDLVVRRVMYHNPATPDSKVPALCWQKADGTFQLRFMFDDYTGRVTVGRKSKACIVIPGDGSPILCEGAEDALAIWQATGRTVWASCGNLWQCTLPEETEEITVVFDNDTQKSNPISPEEQAELVEKTLAHLDKCGVTTVYATMPEGVKDVGDLIMEADGDQQPVIELIKSAAPLGEQPADDDSEQVLLPGAVIVCNDDLLATPIPEQKWIIPNLIGEGMLCSLAGRSGIGKTRFFASFVALAAAGRLELMGLPRAAPFSCVWIANEESSEGLRRRVKAAAELYGVTGKRPYVLIGKDMEQFQLVERNEENELVIHKGAVNRAVGTAKAVNAKMMIIDPLTTLSEGMDENSVKDVAFLNKAFFEIMRKTGEDFSLLSVHHTGKGIQDYGGSAEAWRGSSGLYSPLDVGLTLAPVFDIVEGPKGGKKLVEKKGYISLAAAKIREGRGVIPATFHLTDFTISDGYSIGVTEYIESIAVAEAGEAALSILVETIAKWLGDEEKQVTELHRYMMGTSGWYQGQDGKLRKEEREELAELLAPYGINIFQKGRLYYLKK